MEARRNDFGAEDATEGIVDECGVSGSDASGAQSEDDDFSHVGRGWVDDVKSIATRFNFWNSASNCGNPRGAVDKHIKKKARVSFNDRVKRGILFSSTSDTDYLEEKPGRSRVFWGIPELEPRVSFHHRHASFGGQCVTGAGQSQCGAAEPIGFAACRSAGDDDSSQAVARGYGEKSSCAVSPTHCEPGDPAKGIAKIFCSARRKKILCIKSLDYPHSSQLGVLATTMGITRTLCAELDARIAEGTVAFWKWSKWLRVTSACFAQSMKLCNSAVLESMLYVVETMGLANADYKRLRFVALRSGGKDVPSTKSR